MASIVDGLGWVGWVALLGCSFKVFAASGSSIEIQPQRLVFNSVAGQPCPTVQLAKLVPHVTGTTPSPTWRSTSKPTWLALSAASGPLPGTTEATVIPTGLPAGVYEGTVDFAASGLDATPTTLSVVLIVNTNARVRVSRWRDGKKGALSVSVDDTLPSGVEALESNSLRGTYFLNGSQAPPYVAALR